jgi:hypothetical protein
MWQEKPGAQSPASHAKTLKQKKSFNQGGDIAKT